MDTARQMKLLGALALVADIAGVFFGVGFMVAGAFAFGGLALAVIGGLFCGPPVGAPQCICRLYFSLQNRIDRVRGNRGVLIC